MRGTLWCAGLAGRASGAILPQSLPSLEGVTAERLVPLAGERPPRQQVSRLGTLLQQVGERAGNLADEILRLAVAELRIGRDRADVELPFARVVLGVFGHEA